MPQQIVQSPSGDIMKVDVSTPQGRKRVEELFRQGWRTPIPPAGQPTERSTGAPSAPARPRPVVLRPGEGHIITQGPHAGKIALGPRPKPRFVVETKRGEVELPGVRTREEAERAARRLRLPVPAAARQGESRQPQAERPSRGGARVWVVGTRQFKSKTAAERYIESDYAADVAAGKNILPKGVRLQLAYTAKRGWHFTGTAPAPEREAVEAFRLRNIITDPKTGKQYYRADIEKMHPDPKVALALFREGGLANIERHNREVRRRIQRVLRPYRIQDELGAVIGYDLARLVRERRAAGVTYKAIATELRSLGFQDRDISLALRQAGPGHKPAASPLAAAAAPPSPVAAAGSRGYRAPKGIARIPRAITPRLVKEIGLSMVPIYGTARFYRQAKQKGLSKGEVAMLAGSAALDVLTLAPVVGWVGASARAARGVGTGARAARGARGLVQIALAEAKAPYTVLRHPVRTLKTIAGAPETALRPRKLPLSTVEIKQDIVTVPVGHFPSPQVAMEARDAATLRAIRGQKGAVEVGGVRLELPRTALQKVASPVAVHSTPDIRPFLEGAVIKPGREGGLFVAPNVATEFTLASGFGDIPQGGIRGALLIRDPKVLRALVRTRKVFLGGVEMEAKLPAGIKLPKPSQVLMTRDAAGEPLALLVFGRPLTRSQLARLKLIGTVENIRHVFTPAARVKRTRATAVYDDVLRARRRVVELKREAARLRRAGDKAAAARAEAAAARAEARAARLAESAAARLTGRTPLRLIALNTQARGPLTRWQQALGTTSPSTPRPSTRRPASGATRLLPMRIPAGLPARLRPEMRVSPTPGRPATAATPQPVPVSQPPVPRGPRPRPTLVPRPVTSPSPRPSPRPTPSPQPGTITFPHPGPTPFPHPGPTPTPRPRGTPRTPPRFRLPTGRVMPPGIYPREVTWPQGFTQIVFDLDTQRRTYHRRRSEWKKSPLKGFRVLRRDRTPPPEGEFDMGVMHVRVTPRDLTFRRRRQF